MKERYHVTGMSCSACSSHVEKAVNKLENVEKASVNLLTETMDVTYDETKITSTEIIDAVVKAGYGASVMTEGSAAGAGGQSTFGNAGSTGKSTADGNQELQQKLARMGLDVDESHFYTSALATARFISSQAPGCSAYVIGGAGLIMALHDEGITMNDVDPDYVIIGEGNSYNYENILKAVRLVLKGAKLIGTNSDLTGPAEDGINPASRAMIAPIEMATGQTAYFVGKPNPLMMRTGLRILGVHSEDAVMIGDRMDTDMVAGIETGLYTALVLSGVTDRTDIKKFPYRPQLVLNGVGDIPDVPAK